MDVSTCRKPDFGYTLYEAFKLLYASLYCDDLYKFFDLPVILKNIPFFPSFKPDEDVITTETLFNLLSGLAAQLSALISIENIVGIGDGGDNQSSDSEE